jgi:putative RNA 2'-phosphotransferase
VGKDISDLSRAVSHALRHEPWLYELELDAAGWASVESVLVALRKQRTVWASLAEGDLAHMIETSTKRRHEIKDGRIRALYGHSLAGKLKRTPATPPSVLYHGTAPDVVSLIKSSGLLPMGRQYVHLSVDEATAVEVGRRKAKTPTILHVLAEDAHANGIRFYEGNEKVWLADHVPSEFIEGGEKGDAVRNCFSKWEL